MRIYNKDKHVCEILSRIDRYRTEISRKEKAWNEDRCRNILASLEGCKLAISDENMTRDKLFEIEHKISSISEEINYL